MSLDTWPILRDALKRALLRMSLSLSQQTQTHPEERAQHASRRMGNGLLLAASACGAAIMIAPSVIAANEDLPAPIASCIRDNAPKVEQAVASLPEAADFLMNKLCAAPIASEEGRLAKEQQRKLRERLEEKCAKEKASGQPHKPQDYGDHGACQTLAIQDDSESFVIQLYSSSAARGAPANATSLAAQTLLDLRLARLKADSSKEAR